MTSLGGFAQQQARRFGDTPLFFSGDEVVSYRGYDERTDRLAGGLARHPRTGGHGGFRKAQGGGRGRGLRGGMRRHGIKSPGRAASRSPVYA
ncbi:MAG: hypothetical protein AAB328_09980 [candidate division NC10 bacterium]